MALKRCLWAWATAWEPLSREAATIVPMPPLSPNARHFRESCHRSSRSWPKTTPIVDAITGRRGARAEERTPRCVVRRRGRLRLLRDQVELGPDGRARRSSRGCGHAARPAAGGRSSRFPANAACESGGCRDRRSNAREVIVGGSTHKGRACFGANEAPQAAVAVRSRGPRGALLHWVHLCDGEREPRGRGFRVRAAGSGEQAAAAPPRCLRDGAARTCGRPQHGIRARATPMSAVAQDARRRARGGRRATSPLARGRRVRRPLPFLRRGSPPSTYEFSFSSSTVVCEMRRYRAP